MLLVPSINTCFPSVKYFPSHFLELNFALLPHEHIVINSSNSSESSNNLLLPSNELVLKSVFNP